MGALFFLILMAILFFIALFFIIISTIFLIVWKVRKQRGKTPKKRWFVIPVVILIINIIVAMIPVGYIGFLRYVNSKTADEIVYAESGKSLYWPMGKYESTTNWFEMDGTKYVQFRDAFSKELFFLSSTKDKRGEPVANIRYNPVYSSAFNKVIIFLMTGSTKDKLNASTVYPIINENGFEFFDVSGSTGGGIFCPESKLGSIKAYYADSSNYDTENLTCEYGVYTNERGLGKRHDVPFINIEKEITAAPEVFEELHQTLDSDQGVKRVEIPQKYIELDNAAQPGTPIFGYDERQVFAYSKDKMAYREVYLVLLDGQVYVEHGSEGNYIDGYPLPEDMNKYIKETVFID